MREQPGEAATVVAFFLAKLGGLGALRNAFKRNPYPFKRICLAVQTIDKRV